jgi:hypothetical protein
VASGGLVQVAVSSSLGVDGEYSVVVREVDAAGNAGIASSAVTFTLDTTVPAPALAFDSGVYVKDIGGTKYTKASSLVFTFSGLASDAGTERKLYLRASNGDLTLLQAAIDGDDVTVTDVRFDTDGTYTVVGKIEDHAGNESGESTALTFTVDRTKPTSSSVVSTIGKGYIELTFSEAILFGDVSKFTVKKGTATEAVQSVVVDKTDPKKVKLFMAFFATDSSKSYTVEWEKGAVVDRVGNEVAATTKALSMTKNAAPATDTTAPKFSNNVSFSQSSLVISFDEKLKDDKTGVTTSNIVLYTVSGETETKVSLASVYYRNVAYNVAALYFSIETLTKGTHYRLKVSAGIVEDESGNENDAFIYDWIQGGVVQLAADGLTVVDGNTLRVNFEREIEAGHDESIVIERKTEGGYESVLGNFSTLVSGKTLTITTESSLENDVIYRVKVGKWVVRDKAWDRFSGEELTTEDGEYDILSPELDTTRDGGIAAGEKLIKVFFDEEIKVGSGKTLADEVRVKDSDGGTVAVSSVVVKGSTLQITTTPSLSSSKRYKVEIRDGALDDGLGNDISGTGGLTTTSLEVPFSGSGPVVTKISVSKAVSSGFTSIATVTMTFDEEISILDADNLTGRSIHTVSSTGHNIRRIFTVTKDASNKDTQLVFRVDVDNSNTESTLSLTVGEGFVSKKDDSYTWNKLFSHTTGEFSQSRMTSWTRPGSSEEGGDFVGLGVASEADYGF